MKMSVCLAIGVVSAIPGLASAQVAAPKSAAHESDTATRSGTELEEVTVVAQKRSENLQSTPAAITAVQGEQMVAAGITDIRGAELIVPSVRFQQEGAATEFYVRGVGSTLDSPQLDPPTGFNFNGVYTPREGTSNGLYDVASLEVLPGPQGTLYGRSAIAGTINVNFKRPAMENSSYLIQEVGNYSMFHTTLVQNQQLSDNLAVRAAVDYMHRTGYQKSGADSADDPSLRLSLLYRPTDKLEIYVWGSAAKMFGHPGNVVGKGTDPVTGLNSPDSYLNSDPWNDQFPAKYVPLLPQGQPTAGTWKFDGDMVGGEINYQVNDALTLTDIPAFVWIDSKDAYFLGPYKYSVANQYKQFSNELRLAGRSEKFNWLAGLYAYRMDASLTSTFGSWSLAAGGPATLSGNVGFNRLQGVSVFGDGTYNLTSRLRVTAGGRYSVDSRRGDGVYLDKTVPSLLSNYVYDKDFNHFDWKIGAQYDLAPHSMAYANIQTGYQVGTFNTFANTPGGPAVPVAPSKLTAYILGIKNRFLDGRLQVNDEVFYYQYDDLIASSKNSLGRTTTFNAQRVNIYGNQLDILFQLTADDRLTLSPAYLHARNDRFVTPLGANYDGLSPQYAPDWTVGASYQHDVQLSSGYLRANLSTHYESSFYAGFQHLPGTQQKENIRSSASLTYYANSRNWSIGAWVKNIENEAVVAATGNGQLLPNNPNGATTYLQAPRTFGLRLTIGQQ